MRRKNWVVPGFLVLVMLLLLSFPGLVLAEESNGQPVAAGETIMALPAHSDIEVIKPVVTEPSAVGNSTAADEGKADEGTAPAPATPAPADNGEVDNTPAPAPETMVPEIPPAPVDEGKADEGTAPAPATPAPADNGEADNTPAPAPETAAPVDNGLVGNTPAPAPETPAPEPTVPADNGTVDKISAPASQIPSAPMDESRSDGIPARGPETPSAPVGESKVDNTPAPAPEKPALTDQVREKDELGVTPPDIPAPDKRVPSDREIQKPVPVLIVIDPEPAAENGKSTNPVVVVGTQTGREITAGRVAPGYVAPGYVVQPGDTLDKISEKTGIPVESLKETNGLNVDDHAVAQPLEVVSPTNGPGHNPLPVTQGGEPVENAVPPVMYRVRKGESLWLIGRNLGVPYQDIMKANGLSDHLIYPEQELIIPGLESSNGVINYRVKKGDTLYFIGLALGVSYEDIMSLNGLTDIWIYPGQEFKIPDRHRASLYRVKEGDTLADVAAKFDVSASDILGHEVSDDQLYVGQVLIIPKGHALRRDTQRTRTVSAIGSDLELLARAIYAEARGEIYEGQVAVGAVIMNRLKNVAFPKTIKDIIFQPGAFTAVDDGQINLTPNGTAYKAAQDALDGADPSLGALYYWNPELATSKWVWTRPIIKKIGNHVFAR